MIESGHNFVQCHYNIITEMITTISRSKFGELMGALSTGDLERVEDTILLVLGFAG
jgi:hypothetical protein